MRRQCGNLVLAVLTGGLIGVLGCAESPKPKRPLKSPSSHRDQCLQNVKQLGVVIAKQTSRSDTFPHNETRPDGIIISWRVDVLPTYGFNELYAEYDQSETWTSEQNTRVAMKRVSPLTCPAAGDLRDKSGGVIAGYALVTGSNAAVRSDSALNPSDVSDGLTNTIIAGEACGLGIVWTEPRDIDIDTLTLRVSGAPLNQDSAFSSAHKGGTHVLMADGSVRFLSSDTSTRILKAMTTAHSGD